MSFNHFEGINEKPDRSFCDFLMLFQRRSLINTMKKELFIAVLILNIICVNTTLAQLSLNTVSASIGTIRTLFPDYSFYQNYQYSVYPEVQIGGNFLIPSLRWIACWGYWMDGVEKALPVADHVTYSYSSHIVGARFNFLPAKLLPHWPLLIGVFTGVAHHFISGKYVGGFGYDGKLGQNITDDATTIEIGLNANVQVLGPVAVRGEVQQFFPLGNEEFDQLQKNRRAYKVGLAFTF